MRLYFCTLIFILTINGIAQNNTFKGLVLDNNYEPLPGAIIKIKGTNFICGTDDNGICQISKVPNGLQTFHASYIGNSDTEMTIEFPLLRDRLFTFVLKIKVDTDVIEVPKRTRSLEFVNLEKNNWDIVFFDTLYIFNNIYFKDENTGWAVGGKNMVAGNGLTCDNGAILHTTDGGKNWETRLFENAGCFKSICFLNQNTGFVIGFDRVLKTTDEGRNWIKLDFPGLEFEEIYFENENTGYLRAFKVNQDFDIFYSIYYILTTSDGGINWNTKRIVNENEYQNYFPKKNSIFKDSIQFELSNNLLRVTKDDGNTWNALCPPALGSIFFINDKVGYAISPRGMYLLKTTTGGE